jgi:hypothetical protein
MSMIQPTRETETAREILHLRKAGWDICIREDHGVSSLEISTPRKKGYSFNVDEDGNVQEYISGDYVQVVMGSSIRKTMESGVLDSEGPQIIRSGENYAAITAPKIHLNPEELVGPIQPQIPRELKEY